MNEWMALSCKSQMLIMSTVFLLWSRHTVKAVDSFARTVCSSEFMYA